MPPKNIVISTLYAVFSGILTDFEIACIFRVTDFLKMAPKIAPQGLNAYYSYIFGGHFSFSEMPPYFLQIH